MSFIKFTGRVRKAFSIILENLISSEIRLKWDISACEPFLKPGITLRNLKESGNIRGEARINYDLPLSIAF